MECQLELFKVRMDEEEHKDGCTLSHQPQSDGSTEQMRSTEKSSSNITPSNSSAQESNPSSAESSAVQTSISSTSDSKSHQPHTSPTSLSAYSASSSCPSFPSCQQSPSKIETIFQPITSFPAIAASSSPSGCTEIGHVVATKLPLSNYSPSTSLCNLLSSSSSISSNVLSEKRSTQNLWNVRESSPNPSMSASLQLLACSPSIAIATPSSLHSLASNKNSPTNKVLHPSGEVHSLETLFNSDFKSFPPSRLESDARAQECGSNIDDINFFPSELSNIQPTSVGLKKVCTKTTSSPNDKRFSSSLLSSVLSFPLFQIADPTTSTTDSSSPSVPSISSAIEPSEKSASSVQLREHESILFPHSSEEKQSPIDIG
ncbi:uncharacterized protein MONOS_13395 [Monocercomonoides exilis]|uniref:uncharacterized protein n=1 Tax=Monocercomonoides exilis TaxID=2049356 RepID=UPI003559526F|nr:hypothetical protein MONOS_13395 [Monocercomonoides exilis]|eukprot:MONOS_13395.1-p1 / transcript=MONOS_13395.1 / gene=MONOS_13395 / organism=Monocercomonoides_exilis_PA203 / gene_product=unspecified product / transcript_product=unspecified product / location=Mono_scaffold00821:18533-20215(-) / protein_length=373 / sequence_SO=supercontig / SO=protein_coding / is_pseudo=false